MNASSKVLSVPTSANVKAAKTVNSKMKHPMEVVATSRSQHLTRQVRISANNRSVCDEAQHTELQTP